MTRRHVVARRHATKGRSAVIESGWDRETGTWEHDSPAGKLLVAIRVGNYLGPAAEYAKIHRGTVFRWLQRAREYMAAEDLLSVDELDRATIPVEVLPYLDLLAEMSRSEATAEVELVTLLRAAAREDWRAAVALLARRHPERWKEQLTTELTGAGGGPVEVELSEADLARRIAANPAARELASQLLAELAPVAPPKVGSIDVEAIEVEGRATGT